jgi:type II secretory pathway component PulM
MAIRAKLLSFWQQRTPREKIVASVAALFLAVTVVYPTFIEPVVAAFAEQSKKIDSLKNTYSVAPDILDRYSKLVVRRKEIDSFYSQADLSADPLSYLEGLLKDTAQAAGSYEVAPRQGMQLGGKYSHKFFLVKFKTASYENLVAFLKAITSGKQPMLISQIDLDKQGAGDSLSVQLEVSGFEAIGK